MARVVNGVGKAGMRRCRTRGIGLPVARLDSPIQTVTLQILRLPKTVVGITGRSLGFPDECLVHQEGPEQ